MTNDTKKTEIITIWGIVQGVGFRPFVTKLADSMNINGHIKNMGGFVQLTVSDTEDKIQSFINSIKNNKPEASEIVRMERQTTSFRNIQGFSIEESEIKNDEIGMIPADMAICDECLAEFNDPQNPRYQHPFISCMVCGPRYTIIDSLPYDRDNTTMKDFPMCEFCSEQYNDRNARRFHSQTISCHNCGPMPEYIDKDGKHITVEPEDNDPTKAVRAAITDIKNGEVIALKGTGGYYFVCSPFDDNAVKKLREIKIREEKPFAVMFKDIKSIRQYCNVSNKEEKLLTSSKRPIVLLEQIEAKRTEPNNIELNKLEPQKIEANKPELQKTESNKPEPKKMAESVCRSSRYIGGFLPSFGLQYQLIEGAGPLIMTSANLSDLPIIYKDEEMLEVLKSQGNYNQEEFIVSDNIGDDQIRGNHNQDILVKSDNISEDHLRDNLKVYEHIQDANKNGNKNGYQNNEYAHKSNQNNSNQNNNTQAKLKSVLLNRREIRMSLDDSVARVIDDTPQLTRRSKGYAPIPIFTQQPQELTKENMVFATGGQLKSAFSLSKGNFAYVSQYFGDLDSLESMLIYENNFHRMKRFFGIEPDVVVCDLHPLYNTTKLAEEYVKNQNKLRDENNKIKLIKVQHHHAHTASVMAEHNLNGPVIGVSFDGTGYGTDGNIWGGEFLICNEDEFERYSHLDYVDMIGGDSSMKEGWKSAVSYKLAKTQRKLDINSIIDYSIKRNTLGEFTEIKTVESAIKNRINTVKTSSMGRLFDAVSSLLGIRHTNRYEGECAIMLENAAYNAMNNPNHSEADYLALKFHEEVANYIFTQCSQIRSEKGINTVALSGGVFQNKILMEKSLKLLRKNGFDVHYNSAVPTNDGGISLGQNLIGMYHLSKSKIELTP